MNKSLDVYRISCGDNIAVKPKIVQSVTPIIAETDPGFWIGHPKLGDVIGFVAAAHLYSVKTGKRVKVYFQESRKGILDYFEGVDWVHKDEIPNAIDCGGNPTIQEWSSMNGVKRFYKWMDPMLSSPKTFDIHFNVKKGAGDKLIGLVTHAYTQGYIPDSVVDEMVSLARLKFPEHKIIAIGNMDNKYIPEGVEDQRQTSRDIKWIVETVRKLDLLITPQSGPAFIAAGWKVPMWVYRSKDAHWDYVLNYDNYKVEKWFDRIKDAEDSYSRFDSLYRKGGWSGMGSGPGSNPELNKEYLYMLHRIIDYTPGIQTVVDLGCGDFRLMKELRHSKGYVGVDTSQYIIDENRKKYTNIEFECVNIVTDELPTGDLAIVKDVLQHLPNEDIMKVLEKLKKFKWVIVTNDYTAINGGDISVGDWRPINILMEPFNVDGIALYGYISKQVVLIRN